MVLPALRRAPADAGEIVFFDRSWYNRAVVEKVSASAPTPQRELFFQQVPDFENALVEDGIIFVKIWLNVGRTEQLARMLDRGTRPPQAVEAELDRRRGAGALGRLHRCHPRDLFDAPIYRTRPGRWSARTTSGAPGSAAIRAVLSQVDYRGKIDAVASGPDPEIAARQTSGMPKRGYHHGNLRQALVDAALELIEQKGPTRLYPDRGRQGCRRHARRGLPPLRGTRGPDRRGGAAGLRDLRRPDGARLRRRPALGAGGVREDGARLSRVFPKVSRALRGDVRVRHLDQSQRRPVRRRQPRVPGAWSARREALSEHIPPERRPPPQMFSAHVWALSHGVVELFSRGSPGTRSPFPPEDLLESGHRHLPPRPRPDPAGRPSPQGNSTSARGSQTTRAGRLAPAPDGPRGSPC